MDRDLQDIASRLRDAILNTTSDAILATDRQGVIRFWNRGAIRIFGFTAQEAIGASLDLIIPERLRKRHWDGYERVMASGETRYGAGDRLAVPAVAKGGRQISVEFTIILLQDSERRSPAWPRSCAMSPLVSRNCAASSVNWRSADPTRMPPQDHDDIRARPRCA
jgi:PAS domain S-box-containing protein